jgi:hypothetical protein
MIFIKFVLLSCVSCFSVAVPDVTGTSNSLVPQVAVIRPREGEESNIKK